VENDANVRAAMMAVLEQWGTSPIEAAGRSQAEAQIADLGLAPDVILADYLLDDGEDGITLVTQLRARFGPIPAILITANHSPDLAERAAREGLMLMTKPLALRRLKRVLQSLPHYRTAPADDPDSAPRPGDYSYWLR
jgi:hypothetical protein